MCTEYDWREARSDRSDACDLSHSEAVGVAESREARHDRTAALALVPYGAWCAFATAPNASIARRNSGT
ncbi:tryptophan-rich sensory protein [Streptomyces collinus]|uniref:tryptophan-rich sensory protein n=1 Tax=Streptomyces collinus TaxID=42684 RepID=UPI000D128969|nr:tryptophan-rich sensory protein [Streptomyces collinus]